MAKNNFELVVKTRDETLFQGEVESVTSLNKVGKFDILGHHSNFITLIQETLEIRESGGGKRNLQIDSGLARVSKDKVEIYLGIKQFLGDKQ